MKHPAPFPNKLIPLLQALLPPEEFPKVLDPFAGTGRIHELSQQTFGVELEPEWASMRPETLVGDATALPFVDGAFDAIATSPAFGNRMADSHEAKDSSYRNTYTHVLGRKLTDGNAGKLQWGKQYQQLHLKAWAEAYRVLKPGGRFVLNIKDHIRGGQQQFVSGWHATALIKQGLVLEDVIAVQTKGLPQGHNWQVRTPNEWVFVFNKEL